VPWRVVFNNVTLARIERVVEFDGPQETAIYRFIADRLDDGGYQLNFAARPTQYADWGTVSVVPIVILDHVFNIMHEARVLWCAGKGLVGRVPEGDFGEGSVAQFAWLQRGESDDDDDEHHDPGYGGTL